MKAVKRHQEIIELVQTHGFVSTDDLVERFNVSPQTIRRDLNELADDNKLRRNHGGATLASSSENSSYQSRQVSLQPEKEKVAAALVKHIPNCATLFIDIGTTPEAIARALLVNHEQLRIVTNNINVATILMTKPDFKVILAGGEVRNIDGGVTGEATLDFISQFRLDFGILGISGIDHDGSLLDFDYHEVRVKRAIIENSRCVLLGVDHTKFGRNAMVKLGTIADVDIIITDTPPPEEIDAFAKENSVTIEVV
ncbi:MULTISPECIES: DeoR/GlpR family transcriptional regulator [Vibrio]|uniref:Transcriptional regulator n=2 Tax=Vibrio TaxID=662 RepID=A0A1E5CWP7_9VIBR|nr:MULTISPECIES: DeoR/GlpR family transcriptional regulator [Vibrio]NOH82290.1 DeoR/GlpR family transcriptional regulator [Vibrio sp. 03-59-1]RBW64629.1 DeoR/GlpR family transcriptional regulator [Vibrionales bacterium C3R12]MDN3697121.1 DeoR/GlpR family transcriptional regulator [Vibrio cortegadensis]OEE74810.1 transcriptional regulator [Vibrio genomosp. F6 str. FF-238]TKF21688.1 DeoR/GlpR family transcriptional regulator [Vibrio genomosp. F6]